MIWYYLDDERDAPQGTVLVRDPRKMIDIIDFECYTPQEELLQEFGIDFDHDLGCEDFNGYTVARYIVRNKIPMAGFKVHSMNPIGAENIRQPLIHYGYKEY